MLIFFREREREHHRQELWNKVETLASRRPEYEVMSRNNINNSNNIIGSPDDEEVNLDNIDAESQDVSFSHTL